MYEKHFALDKRPFAGGLRSADVFVGPQIATAIAGLKKAVARPDAVVAVSGPAGVGKTIVVAKALEALGPQYKLIRIGRMHLDGSDVMEHLLQALGVKTPPEGAIRRFAAFRKLLEAIQAQDMRVVVVLEDAGRIGLEALAELEAVTAADAGPSTGANLVLMGNDRLGELLKDPQLERLAQRTRHRQRVEPLGVAELRGFMKHALRRAGGEFQAIFDTDSIERLAQLTGGIPRVVNELADAALAAAAREGDSLVTAGLIASVAADELGLDVPDAAPQLQPAAAPEPLPAPEPETEPETAPETEPEHAAGPEPDPEPVAIADTPAEAEPIIVFSDEPADGEPPLEDDEIPELIQDTLPDLEILAPEVMAAADTAAENDDALPTLEADPEQLPRPGFLTVAEPPPETDDLPELQPLTDLPPTPQPEPAPEPRAEIAAEPPAHEVPDRERDPTLAQLKPDLDALEAAMAANKVAREHALEEPVAPEPEQEPVEIPEITLDHAIRERIDSNRNDQPGPISPPASEAGAASSKSGDLPEIELVPAKTKRADPEIERIASELARAKTIEDVDDKMAETLFGEEFSLVAAAVMGDSAGAASANDGELVVPDASAAQQAQATGTPASGSVEVAPESPEHNGGAGLDISASQRLRTVRALNTASTSSSLPEPENAPAPVPDPPAGDAGQPAPIEDQINISMTQTLKALNVEPPVLDDETDVYDEDEDDDEKKGGFFSRFRRS